MVDLVELQSRVNAAKDQYGNKAEQQGKLVLRLNDLAIIVEGSLAKQRKALEMAEVKLRKWEADNEQLRGMVITLLNLVETRSLDNLHDIMHRLDRSVTGMIFGADRPALQDDALSFSQDTLDPNYVPSSSERSVITLRR